jgi:protein DEK
LLQFLDVLDVHVSRTLKKEELVGKVLEFLEKPHKTTERLLEVKEQEKKSTGKRSSAAKGPGRPKIRKGDEKTPSKKRARKSAAEDDGSDGSEKVSDSESPVEEIEQKRLTFKDDTDHEEESMVEEKKQASNSSTANKLDIEENEVEEEEEHEEKEQVTPPRKKSKVEAPDATLKTPSKSADRFYSKKKSSEDTPNKETSVTPSRKGPGRPKKSVEKSFDKPAKKTAKDKETGKKSSVKAKKSKSKDKTEIPSDEELQAQIRELLVEADFSKVTFTDVVSQLEAHFGLSLTERKGHVKGLIRDEISKLTEADDEPEEEVAAGEASKEEKAEDMVTS